MIDLEDAKNRVMQWLNASAARHGSPPRIIEEKIEEHEWGWIIPWEPTDRNRLPPDKRDRVFFPYIVDRLNGRVRHVSTAGLTIAVSKLLWEREGPLGQPDAKS